MLAVSQFMEWYLQGAVLAVLAAIQAQSML
jgi:hypothetical protein